MPDIRHLPARDYAALKSAFAALTDEIGGQSAAARLTRVGQQTLSTYQSLAEDFRETFAPLDVVADLEAEATSRGGRPLVSECLAALAGYTLSLSEAKPADRSWCAELGLLAKDFGDFAGRLAQANADNAIDAAEAKDCLAAAEEARASFDEVILRLRGLSGPGPNTIITGGREVYR